MFNEAPKLQPIKNKTTNNTQTTTKPASASTKDANSTSHGRSPTGSGRSGRNATPSRSSNQPNDHMDNYADSGNGNNNYWEAYAGEQSGRGQHWNYLVNNQQSYPIHPSNRRTTYYTENYNNYNERDRNYNRFRYQRNHYSSSSSLYSYDSRNRSSRYSPQSVNYNNRNRHNEKTSEKETSEKKKEDSYFSGKTGSKEKERRKSVDKKREDSRKEEQKHKSSNSKKNDKQQEKTANNLRENNNKDNSNNSKEKSKSSEDKAKSNKQQEFISDTQENKKQESQERTEQKTHEKTATGRPKATNTQEEKEKHNEKQENRSSSKEKEQNKKVEENDRASSSKGTEETLQNKDTDPRKAAQEETLSNCDTDVRNIENSVCTPIPDFTENVSETPVVIERSPVTDFKTELEDDSDLSDEKEFISIVNEVDGLPPVDLFDATELPDQTCPPKISLIPFSRLVRAEFIDLAAQFFATPTDSIPTAVEANTVETQTEQISLENDLSNTTTTPTVTTAAAASALPSSSITTTATVRQNRYKPNLVQRKRNQSISGGCSSVTTSNTNNSPIVATQYIGPQHCSGDIVDQIMSMNSAGIKQIINSSESKYEKALQIEARRRLREEIRKQLKSLTLEKPRFQATKVTDLTPDEFVDAIQIPKVLLEQIRQAFGDEMFQEQIPAPNQPKNSTETMGKTQTDAVATETTNIISTETQTSHLENCETQTQQNDGNINVAATTVSERPVEILENLQLTASAPPVTDNTVNAKENNNNNNNNNNEHQPNKEQTLLPSSHSSSLPVLTAKPPHQPDTVQQTNSLMHRIKAAEQLKKSPPRKTNVNNNKEEETAHSSAFHKTQKPSPKPGRSPQTNKNAADNLSERFTKKKKRFKKRAQRKTKRKADQHHRSDYVIVINSSSSSSSSSESSSSSATSTDNSGTSDSESDSGQSTSSNSSSVKRHRSMRQKRDAENVVNTFEKLILPTLSESLVTRYEAKFSKSLSTKLHFISCICTSEYNSEKFSKAEIAKIQHNLKSTNKQMSLEFLMREIVRVSNYQKQIAKRKVQDEEAKKQTDEYAQSKSNMPNRISSTTAATTMDGNENVIKSKSANTAEKHLTTITTTAAGSNEADDADAENDGHMNIDNDNVNALNEEGDVADGVEDDENECNTADEADAVNATAGNALHSTAHATTQTQSGEAADKHQSGKEQATASNKINDDAANNFPKPITTMPTNDINLNICKDEVRSQQQPAQEQISLNHLINNTSNMSCFTTPNLSNLSSLSHFELNLSNPLGALGTLSGVNLNSSFTEQTRFPAFDLNAIKQNSAIGDAVVTNLREIDLRLMELHKRKMFIEEMILKFQKDKMDVEMLAMKLQNEKFVLLNTAITANATSMSTTANPNTLPISTATITSSTTAFGTGNETTVITTTTSNNSDNSQSAAANDSNISTTTNTRMNSNASDAGNNAAKTAKKSKVTGKSAEITRKRKATTSTATAKAPPTPPSRKSKRLSLQNATAAQQTETEEDDLMIVEIVPSSSGQNGNDLPTTTNTLSEESSDSTAQHRHCTSMFSDLPAGQTQNFKSPITQIRVFEETIFAASEMGLLFKINLRTLQREASFAKHQEAITHMYVCPERRLIYTTSLDGYLKKTDIEHLDMDIDSIYLHEPLQVIDVKWNVAFIGTRWGNVITYNIAENSIGQQLLCATAASITSLKATKEGPRKILVISSKGNTIHFRDACTGLLLRILEIPESLYIYSLLLDENQIYCGTQKNEIYKFDFTTGTRINVFNCGNGAISLQIYQKKYLFIGCYDGFIYILNKETGQQMGKFPGSGKMVLSLEIAGNKIITSSKDNTMKIIEIPIKPKPIAKELRGKIKN